MNLKDVLRMGPVMPVIVIHDLAHAEPLAKALFKGGIKVFEVTLRTDVALDAIRIMRDAVPEAIVGAGTVTCPDELEAALGAGAMFAVTPGLTRELAESAVGPALPLLPGVMTPGELMLARDLGFDALKLFPAREAGGVGMLRAMAGLSPTCCSARPEASRWRPRQAISSCRTWPASEEPGWLRPTGWKRGIGKELRGLPNRRPRCE